jgi:hypothetical protein
MSSPHSPEPDPDAADHDRSLSAARRSLTLFVVALAAALIGLIALASGLLDEDSADTTVTPDDDGAVREIGPDAGADVASYADERRQHLTEVEGRRVAVVSFTSYVDEPEAADRLADAVEVLSVLVAVPGGEVRIADSADEERAAAVAEAESQLEEISRLVNTVEDPEFASFYRAELIRYRKLLSAAEREDVVFGAVVQGRAGDLRALGARAGVRLVDVGDGAALADDARISGLRPEESITVGDPPFRP